MQKAILNRLLIAACILAGCTFQVAGEEQKVGLDPMVDKLLRDASDFLRAQEQFTFTAEITYDEMDVADDAQASDLKLQYGATTVVSMRRPDKLRVSLLGDQTARQFYYDGRTATLLAPRENFYGRLEVPPTIDAALDTVYEKTGFDPPLSDLVYANPYGLLAPHVRDSYYIGLHRVRGVWCHHVLLVQETVDWQIWIEAGDQPRPRKLVITYKRMPGSPQYVAVFVDWNLEPGLADEHFAFRAPEGAVQVEMVPTRLPQAR
ncbi:MAG: DUF2092 domain-containing protein [Planctomycetota bacterium]|jgi:hypothetical protein